MRNGLREYSNSSAGLSCPEQLSLTTLQTSFSNGFSALVTIASPLNEEDWSKLTQTLEAFAVAWESSPYPPSIVEFLPDDVARDPQALTRFEREAQAASALNHPNICTVYEISEENGQPFIAMEFLDGETLKHLIEKNPLPFERVLELGIEMGMEMERRWE